MKRILKESVQKMNGRKKYKGELYSFFRSERNIGSGGNGAVYDVEFEGDEGFEFPIVAKFFEYGVVLCQDLVRRCEFFSVNSDLL